MLKDASPESPQSVSGNLSSSGCHFLTRKLPYIRDGKSKGVHSAESWKALFGSAHNSKATDVNAVSRESVKHSEFTSTM